MTRLRAPILRGPVARALGSAAASFVMVLPFWPHGIVAAGLSAALNAAANLTQPDFSPVDEGPAEDRGTARRIVLSVNATVTAALLEHAWVRGGALPSAAWVACAFVVAALGIALRAWSVRTLDRHFTWHVTIVDGHRLVTSGPYRRFRHPSYVGAWLAYVAFPLAIGSWCSALLAAPLLASAFRGRIRLEEARLEAHFGDEWRAFAARVGPTWPLA
jgi:protein-S-isoprenylcysteine O-methyltransferase